MRITFKVRAKILWLLTWERGRNYLRHLTHLYRPLCDCGYDTVGIISQIMSLIMKQKNVWRAEPHMRLLNLIEKECRHGICHKADIQTCECYHRATAALSAVRLLVFGFRNYEKIARLLAIAKLQACFESLGNWRPDITCKSPKPYWVRNAIPIDLNTGQAMWDWMRR